MYSINKRLPGLNEQFEEEKNKFKIFEENLKCWMKIKLEKEVQFLTEFVKHQELKNYEGNLEQLRIELNKLVDVKVDSDIYLSLQEQNCDDGEKKKEGDLEAINDKSNQDEDKHQENIIIQDQQEEEGEIKEEQIIVQDQEEDQLKEETKDHINENPIIKKEEISDLLFQNDHNIDNKEEEEFEVENILNSKKEIPTDNIIEENKNPKETTDIDPRLNHSNNIPTQQIEQNKEIDIPSENGSKKEETVEPPQPDEFEIFEETSDKISPDQTPKPQINLN